MFLLPEYVAHLSLTLWSDSVYLYFLGISIFWQTIVLTRDWLEWENSLHIQFAFVCFVDFFFAAFAFVCIAIGGAKWKM